MAYVMSTLVEVQDNPKTDVSVPLIHIWKYCEIVTVIFVIISLLSSTIDYEINFVSDRTYSNCSETYHDDTNLRWLTFGSSISALGFLLIGEYSKIQWERFLHLSDPRVKPYKIKKNYFKLALESLLLLIFPYESLKASTYEIYGMKDGYKYICYSISELLYAVMWLRLYFILKLAMSFTPFVGHVAMRSVLENKARPGFVFAFKCMFHSNPMVVIIFFIGLPAITMIGMMTRVYERPLIALSTQDWKNPITAIWFSYSTMLLGVYGDYFPLSSEGRFTNVVAYVTGTLFFTMVFLNMQNQAFLSRRQRKAYNDICLMPYAADVIKSSFKYFMALRRFPFRRALAEKKMQSCILKFKNKRTKLDNTIRQRELDVMEVMRSLRKIRKKMDKIYMKTQIASQLILQKRVLEYN